MSYSDIAQRILDLLRSHQDGLDIHQLREFLKDRGPQQHLDRRLRELDPYFIIERKRCGRRLIYQLKGSRAEGDWEYDQISKLESRKD